jgi:hypothetical protein
MAGDSDGSGHTTESKKQVKSPQITNPGRVLVFIDEWTCSGE